MLLPYMDRNSTIVSTYVTLTGNTCALFFLSPSNPTKLQEGFFQFFCKKMMVLRDLQSLHSFAQQIVCRIWMLLYYHDMISQYAITFQVSCCLSR